MTLSRGQITRWVVLALGLGLLAAFSAEAGSILVGRNFHTVVPGRVYRCAQPSADDLDQYVEQYGIKTVINLRGCCSNFEWYIGEGRATAQHDIAQEDLTFSAGRLPSPQELKRLVEVLDRAEYPVLIHCRRGVDRTGLTSALIRMLYEKDDPAAARAELSWRHGHVSAGRTEAMLQFFDLYDEFRGDRRHSPELFRAFITDYYRPGPGSGELTLIAPPDIRAAKAGLIRMRASNSSHEPWQLKPGTGSGIHVLYRISDEAGAEVQSGYAGLFDAVVAPGKSIDLSLVVNPLPAGRYTLQADLQASKILPFSQLGGEPLVTEFIAQ